MSTIFPSNGLIKPAYLNLVKRHICFKKWAIPGLFFIIVTNIKFLQQINMKMSIQFTVLGFEPTTFVTCLLP